MIARDLSPVIASAEWGRQMRFIAGPRQTGKTTLAKAILKKHGDQSLYYNWDDRALKTRYHRGADFLREDLLKMAGWKEKYWVCFDKIHKMPKWKNILKSEFDAHEDQVQFIVTGSARLDLLRRSGDSLAGRYFLFRLFPLTLLEVLGNHKATLSLQSSAKIFIEERLSHSSPSAQSSMEALLKMSGFPEPFLRHNDRFLRIWHRDYLDHLIKEDLRGLTRIAELENVAALVMLLPERVGSPLSVNSLRGDLAVSHETIQNYLEALKLSYFIFELPAYSKKLNRTITKEKKVYFHDWSTLPEEAKRFENYVACELTAMLAGWHDAGLGDFSLHYIRLRDGRECDFLILKDQKPWFLAEAKVSPVSTPSHHITLSENLGGIPIVQLVKKENFLYVGRNNDSIVSASRFFS